MRILVALLILVTGSLASAGPDDDERQRERVFRMILLVEDLQLDDTTAGRLYPVLSRFDKERTKLQAEYNALLLEIATTTDASKTDKLLDRSLVKQRALLQAEAAFVWRLRKVLPASKAARARVVMTAPVLAAPFPSPEPTESTATAPYDPDALFPPAQATSTASCDPFAAMHGCRKKLPF